MSLSQDQKIAIAKHFLISSPPGEFDYVKQDVEKIVDDESITNSDAFKKVYHEYNIEQFTPVLTDSNNPDSRKLIICSYNEVDGDNNKYLDPVARKILTVDHESTRVTASEDDTSSYSDVQLSRRDELQKSVDDYVKKAFIGNSHLSSNECHGISNVFSQKSEDEFIIVISASKASESNKWSGRWRSVYKASYKGNNIEIAGKMKANIHNYETGNSLMNTSREAAGDIKSVSELGALLKKWENEFQRYINEQCENLGDLFKKNFRRAKPVAGVFNFAQKMGMAQ